MNIDIDSLIKKMFTPGLKIFAHLLYGATSLGCCSITHNIDYTSNQEGR